MHLTDWLVLGGTLLFIVGYGTWRTRQRGTSENFLRGEKNHPWWVICISIMATQASAITFLSTPGQAYEDGLRFVQFYFGLPLAMVILSVAVIPIYYKLKVYTAYEFLENRFNLSTRTLTAVLFLVQRGLAAGITIYAPAIILSTILGWNLHLTNLIIGILVIIYVTSGGTEAVSQTQKQQMAVMMGGMLLVLVIVIGKLPDELSVGEALSVAGLAGKINAVDFTFDLSNRYNFWSGILGGTFLFLSYFGTDQSQVQRYLSGRSLTQGRLGLLFNGMLKVPMQFFILFVGIMVFVFFQFNKPPVNFNQANLDRLENSAYQPQLEQLQAAHTAVFEQKQELLRSVSEEGTASEAQTRQLRTELNALDTRNQEIREDVQALILAQNPEAVAKDTDYVFITFILEHLPVGLVGLLLAVILCAAMSSISSELNALATTSVVDIYRRSIVKDKTDRHYLNSSRWFTILWGLLALSFATFASLVENLIEAVNIVGSIFYGVILGIFVVAFFLKFVKGRAVFVAAIISEIIVITIFILSRQGIVEIAYLWLNAIGCLLVMLIATLLQVLLPKKPADSYAT
ncbi:SSS family transporter [Anseongella ginsenosidimutans]|uniref:SSS family transporter n=1 Tax=Anseongella ginsenosidimutans TaxID=496056 RepID=A0A4R3KP73_9SPHI|nr:sodium:solute symporter [Anseongella ginsenosidimutans]QEC53990.1 sodium:solute symporter [Anseongella ginsenosidimutans]TCS86378.1 SSS family transporter [Anseongella ginsenosidimutans]